MMNEEVMSVRPIYRWKSFWLGVLGLAFLGWVWGHSMRHGERIGVIGRDVDASCVMVVEGRVIVSTQYVRDNVPFQLQRIRWPAAQYAGSYPVWAFREWNQGSLLMRWVVFPVWVPLVAWLAVWGGWMVWRWRRGKETSNIEHRTSNIERRTSNVEHRTSNIERPTSNDE